MQRVPDAFALRTVKGNILLENQNGLAVQSESLGTDLEISVRQDSG